MNNTKVTKGIKWGVFITAGILLVIIAFTFLISYLTTLSGYYPMLGYNDFLANASRARFMLDFWPHINWNHEWGSGMPFFLWYAPFPFYLIILFAKIFSDIEMGLAVINVLSFAFMGVGVYGIVYTVTRKRLLAVFSAFLSISLPAYWYRILAGTVPRTISTAFMMVSLWFLVRLLKDYYENNQKINKKIFVFLIIFLTLSLQNHIYITAVTGLFVLIIIFVLVRGLKEKIKMLFKIVTLPLLLSFYFLFPFFVTLSQSVLIKKTSIGIYKAEPADLALYLFHNPDKLVINGGGLNPLVLPFIVIFLLVVLFGRLTRGDSFGKRMIICFFLLTVMLVLFGTAIYLGYPANWYSVNSVPDEGFYFLALVTPVLWGILFYYIFGKRRFLYYTFMAAFFVALGLVIWWQYPQRNTYSVRSHDNYPTSQENREANTINKMLKNDMTELQYRFAHPATEIALYFNYIYRIPQTRDFFAQGDLHPDWRPWLENAIWEWKNNYNEVNFLLDWYGIKWFAVCSPADVVTMSEKYEKEPDLYQRAVENDNFQGFIYKNFSPILSASQSPSLLIVGAKEQNKSYDPVLRDLALLNINSQYLIPVRGKDYIEDYSLDELSKFDSVILYQYKIKNIEKMANLLNNYVENGGGLIIEASDFVDDSLKSELAKKILGVYIREINVNRDWQFEAGNSAIASGIDFTEFSPALYLDSPWKVYVNPVKNDQVENVLLTDGQPVVMAKNFGQGRVIFSGLNLPYHIRNNNQLNLEETKFLNNMYKWVLNGDLEKAVPVNYEMKFISPEKREVSLREEASGVVFKENYFANWHAYLEQEGGKTNLTIYPAGPDFMYVPLPRNSTGATLVFQYKKSTLEDVSLYITIVIGFGFVIYILEGWLFKPILPKLKQLTLGRFSKQTQKWWNKDEEG
ncbi:MAG: 6-pyruvoyl-tetrahydropterin synthase-related protein [Patescibacteria group bacterium]